MHGWLCLLESRTPLEIQTPSKTEHDTLQHGSYTRYITLVELRGFEPLTFSLRTRRATNCAIAPDPMIIASPAARVPARGRLLGHVRAAN